MFTQHFLKAFLSHIQHVSNLPKHKFINTNQQKKNPVRSLVANHRSLAYCNVTFSSVSVSAQMAVQRGGCRLQHSRKHTFNASAEHYRL